ncbi:mitochondrial ribosomal protein S18C [Cochliomyia hominivorax]
MYKITKFVAQNVNVANLMGIRTLGASAIRFATANPDEPIDIKNPFEKERKVCILCKHGITPDYKNVKLLSQFQSPYTGRIYGRHITGLCKQKQNEVEKAIIRAQNCAMMPTYHKDLDFMKDPKLFDPEKPIRPHKY